MDLGLGLSSRWCIVCRSPFPPKRKDQIYHENSCWIALRHKEAILWKLYHIIIVKQEFKCSQCDKEAHISDDQSLVIFTGGLVILKPWMDPYDIKEDDIRIMCLGCRKEYYLGVSKKE